MHVGFILTKTPSQEGFQSFIKFINIYLGKNDVSVYLLGNGVYCARNGHVKSSQIREILQKARIHAYQGDLLARGIKNEQLIPGIEPFESYKTLILTIMEETDQMLSF